MNVFNIQQFKMHKKGPEKVLGNLEARIMEILWKIGEGSVRDVRENLAKKKYISFNTVMTVMNRLIGKQLLQKLRKGGVYCYKAQVTRKTFCQKISESIFRELLHDPQFFGMAGFMSAMERLDQNTLKKIENILKKRH
ncbi:MAG: hypothetical protein A3B74_01680 [Candidatus Kerfeldbacteria bacterium RIFCSPHIGHO2_02_FULL_42_14]|uniref:CopY family transcriptional regulator n=1 Tax=Candidatus Kerfeldbacteria bacterium RIFCSPHIGHO2_02_FULL_42_14 TaxID=1798540 RepID=A0A1G2ATB1_9BACT|nr:MAG: hypothetical protein A3B74_01680 [Candidatus Kerfeldbacteria bacterium RIFCSPHIGHO2_02_FULL_42_14]OGY82259.1 MAG: hypothetical protein A3E60_00010 [Candidatus Kerfeldbacteria bacterium RIFCSPHIGHO2_12_FULL_42_13]OGY82699.1 MAG: hypothetical protein A3I91_00900 [Candidatus Kerfeldbacteria bacterium RIFCSPLOWO2_02_FULL_42_19]OGY87797.1 MAG: hypothetical protein A3G01_05105 [Candidatus Kerfeldbacteria bacterium RIFCSPLOWO2_12_FULL_43_9]